MPYRPGTMKKGPNDARHVVWALDKFFFSMYNRLFTKYKYFSFLLSTGQGQAECGLARPNPWTV